MTKKTIEEKRAEIQKKAAEAQAELDVEVRITEALPDLNFKIIHVVELFGSTAIIKYATESIEQALVLLSKFKVINAQYRQGTFAAIVPFNYDDPKRNDVVKGEFEHWINVDKHIQKLEFYAKLNSGDVVNVEAELPKDYCGNYIQKDPHRRKYWYYQFEPNFDVLGNYNRVINYAPVARHGESSGGTHIYAPK